MYRKITTAVVTALAFAATASVAISAPRGVSAGAGYQSEAPAWSFACIKDNGPTQCGEPIWVYGN